MQKTKTPLETNKLYKLEKKLDLHKQQLANSIERRQLSYEKKKRTALEKSKVDIATRYDKKLSKQVNKIKMLELNKIHNSDCLELMKQIPDKSIDLVLTDPPYGIGIKGKVGWEKLAQVKDYWDFNDRDNKIPDKIYFDEMQRIWKHCIIFWWNYFIEYLTNSPCWIVWDKDNTWNFADCELAWTNFDTAVRKYEFRWNGMLQWDMKNKEIRQHPTQKPIQLFRWILENYSEKWQTILDPFLWSWTTAVACKELGRNFIWIEKESKYCKIAEERLKNTTISLF